MKRSLSIHRLATVVVFTLALSAGLVPAGDAVAQECLEHLENFNYSAQNCEARPDIDRVFRLQEIRWNGHDYLFVDEGNEIRVYNIDDSQNPSRGSSSHFPVVNVGDSDYDLLNFSVCDDCRYGIAVYKAATVLFDLGTGSTPFMSVYEVYDDASNIEGGFTFEANGQQYLVASDLGANACSGSESGLYRFDGVEEDGNQLLQCLGGDFLNGIQVAGTNPPVLYMSEQFGQFNIFRFNNTSGELDNLGNGDIARATMFRGYGVDIDESSGLMAVARSGDLKMYDVGWDNGSPTNPILLSTTDVSAMPSANLVGLGFPVVHVGTQDQGAGPVTYNVSNPANPVILDADFWDQSHAWNSLGYCLWNQAAVFSRDNQALYLARYSSLQVIDPTACQGPSEPTANLSVNPQTIFPGTQVEVTNSSMAGDEYATWITDGPYPHSSNVLAGSIAFTAGTVLAYTLPTDMTANDVFWAHAAVQSDGYPYTQGSTPGQIKSEQIDIIRDPTAAIQLTPQAAITGDTVTMTATDIEGTPSVVGGGSPFEWTVTGPAGEPVVYTGNPVTGQVELTDSGQWTFDLKVFYEHEGDEGQYTYSDQEIKTISSVAAAFTASPSAPLHNEAITLTSTSRAQIDTNLEFDWDVLNANGLTVENPLTACDGPGDVDAQCVIPAETLDWDTYDLRLRLTNTDTEDEDIFIIDNFVVANGNINVDFTISDTTPNIGQSVAYAIQGINGDDIATAQWNFGGPGCTGSQTYTCTAPGPPPFGCEQAAFAYSGSGYRNVTLTVTSVSAGTQPSVNHSVNVSTSGTCGGTSCSYSISPTSRSVSGEGATTTVGVTTTSGCSWTASANSSWISILSGSTGSGSGTVTYMVAPNTGAVRTGTLTVAGRTHTVTQAAGLNCTYSLGTHSGSFAPAGGNGTFNVHANPDSCSWQVSTTSQWILITSNGSNVGTGPVNFTVGENDTPHQRDATIRVTGSGGFNDEFTVTQNHPWIPVNFTMSTTNPEIGETVTFTIDERLEVTSWDFSTKNCRNEGPVMTCPGTAGTCNTVEWSWSEGGPKQITVETTTEPQTKSLTVQGTGECPPYCGKDGAPDASFEMNPSPVLEDVEVAFTDTSSGGGLKIELLGLTYSPASPEIGQLVLLSLTGYGVDLKVDWNFGENGCLPDYPEERQCLPIYGNCHAYSHKFSSAGQKTITAEVYNYDTGTYLGSASGVITIQDVGSCGGGTACTYGLNPENKTVPAAGESVVLSVYTQADCDWTASTTNSWISLNAPVSGTGNGSVTYVAAANTGGARSGSVKVENETHSIYQLGSGGGGGGGGGGGTGDTTPTEWQWTVRDGSRVIVTSTEQNFTHTFRDPGFYDVELVATNCAGSNVATRVLEVIDVIEPTPDVFLVPSAVHTPGLNQTLWKTDLRIFNPGLETVDVSLEYLPEDTDNTQSVIHGINFSLMPMGTRVFDDVVTWIPGILGDDNKGSLRFTYGDETEATPLIMSRTFNETPDGTFGQFVRAVPVEENQDGFLLLTGLAENFYYRTNLSLANFSDEVAWGVTINVLDDRGEIIGNPVKASIQPHSTTQIVKIAEQAGIFNDLDIYSLYVFANDFDITASASIVDNATGDPVHVEAVDKDGATYWVPGVAHLEGANNSVWRSDATFFNSTLDWISTRVNYVSPDIAHLGINPYMNLGTASANAAAFTDILGSSMLPSGVESKGYLVITSRDGSPLPQVVAKTYNVDEYGGTFGQNLMVYDEDDLIYVGESGYITGVSNSPDSSDGFRTNVGVLNTSQDNTAVITIDIYDETGQRVGGVEGLPIAPELLYQDNIFEAVGLGDTEMDGSIKITLTSGGPLLAYASQIDNRTQDPILIPAVQVMLR